jgi:hypothetical protein
MLKKLLPGDLFKMTFMSPFNAQEVTIFGIFLHGLKTPLSKECIFITALSYDGKILDRLLASPKDEIEIFSNISNN